MTRPIAAFSMEDYEKLTRNAYQAAEFKRGKDKKKRKKRGLGFYAGVGAGGLAGAGALAAGARYGGAELGLRSANKRLEKGQYKSQGAMLKDDIVSRSGGAKGVLERDKANLMALGDRIKNYDYKGLPARTGKRIKLTAEALPSYGKQALAKGRAALGTTGGKIGAGLGAAALLGGAGYGAYRMMNKKKKK
jgi:hypothetical protein